MANYRRASQPKNMQGPTPPPPIKRGEADYERYGRPVKGESTAEAAERRKQFYHGQKVAADTGKKLGKELEGRERGEVQRSIGRHIGSAGEQHAGALKSLGMNPKEAKARMAGSAPGTMKSRLAGAMTQFVPEAKVAGAAVRGAAKMIPEASALARKVIPAGRKMLGGAEKAKGPPSAGGPKTTSRGRVTAMDAKTVKKSTAAAGARYEPNVKLKPGQQAKKVGGRGTGRSTKEEHREKISKGQRNPANIKANKDRAQVRAGTKYKEMMKKAGSAA